MSRPAPPALAFQDDQALQTPGPVRDRLIAQMRRQGAKNVRINAIYGRIKAEGYSKLDDEVNALRAAGIQPQVTLMSTPRYSPQWDQTLSAARNDPRVWQQFATEVAKHFRGRVGRYSIGNELQFGTFFVPGGTGQTEAEARAAGRAARSLYRAGYAGVKGADRSAQVLLPELASSPHAKTWLASFLAGKPIRTAGLAFHPYQQGDATATGSWDIDNLKDLQATLARYKRQGKLQTAKGSQAPLYLTEFGYQKAEVSPADRLRKLGAAYALAKQAGARQMLYYQLAPTVRKPAPGPVAADAYGNQFAAPQQPQGWVWDTSIGDVVGNVPVINRGMKLSSRSPVASAARARKKR